MGSTAGGHRGSTQIDHGHGLPCAFAFTDRVVMNSTDMNSHDTKIIKLKHCEAGAWLVCTADVVPIILARFEDHDSAAAWQERLQSTRHAA